MPIAKRSRHSGDKREEPPCYARDADRSGWPPVARRIGDSVSGLMSPMWRTGCGSAAPSQPASSSERCHFWAVSAEPEDLPLICPCGVAAGSASWCLCLAEGHRLTGSSGWNSARRLIGCPIRPKFPPGRWARVFKQVVGPLITKITCLRSHDPTVFHLVNDHVGVTVGGTPAFARGVRLAGSRTTAITSWPAPRSCATA
jgi:hypothetical protein